MRGIYQARYPERPLAELSDDDFLDELGLVRDGTLTHAAVLLFGRQKLTARLKPGGIVDFRQVHLPWSEEVPAHRYDDRVLCEGNVIEALRALIGRFLAIVPNPFALDPTTLQRQAHPPKYPALREALVNLLVHQDYADQHRTARVLWFTDRTVFGNPGDSFVSLSEMIDGGASDLRNPRLARLMRQIGFAEQVGTGISTIVRTWRQVDRSPPVVVNDPGLKTYRLTLGWQPVVKRGNAFWKDRLGESISPDEAHILAWLREVGTAPRGTARLATGATVRDTRELVERLLVEGLIVPADDAAEHVRLAPHVAETLADLATTEHEPGKVTPEVTPEVLRMLSIMDGELGRKEIQARLELSDEKHFREHYQQPAIAQGLMEMTIPDKPKSSRQKYRLTDAGRALLAARSRDRA